ncbi:MAG: molybdate ABC transporter permease subunit, partial [Blastopirellula sp. JB062]
RSISSAIAGVDVRLEEAARTLGARPFDLFWSVTLPLAKRGVVAGFVLAFARALGEFGATIMIAGNIAGETRTIPLMIYSELETPGGERRIASLIAASILISAAALIVSEYLERRSEPIAK